MSHLKDLIPLNIPTYKYKYCSLDLGSDLICRHLLDLENFDVGKNFHNVELIPIEEIPYNDTPEEVGHGDVEVEN